MSPRSWSFRVLVILGFAASLHLPAATPAEPVAPIRNRVDALLKRRIRPESLPLNLPNPFQMNSGVIRYSTFDQSFPAAATPGKPAAPLPLHSAAAAEPAEVLRTLASRFKIGGVIVLADTRHVVINGVPRKAGEFIPTEWNNGLISVQIVRLEPSQLVLRYADTEFTLRF